MRVKFPRKRADGSFSVELIFSASSRLDGSVSDWLSGWTGLNEEWVRDWKSGNPFVVVKSETLRWSDEFEGPPVLLAESSEGLRLRLDAKSGSTYWKDWLVRLVEALIAAFPQLRFDGATSLE